MKKLVIALIVILASLGFAAYGKLEKSVAQNSNVAPCANDGADSAKRYIGGQIIHRTTREPMNDVPVFLNNMPTYFYDSRTNTMPPDVEFETKTNARGEFWFCGQAWKSEYWRISPAGNAYVYPGAVKYYDAGKPDSYDIYFELKPIP